jgi:hypothetical protein
MTRFFSFLFLALAARSCSAFSVVVPNLNMPGGHVTDTALGMGMFGGLSDAFKNEDNLGSRKSEGLSGVSAYRGRHTSRISETFLTYQIFIRDQITTRPLQSMVSLSRPLSDRK